MEQFLHNASTWQDALRIEQATGRCTAEAAVLLGQAGELLESVRRLALRAFQAQLAAMPR